MSDRAKVQPRKNYSTTWHRATDKTDVLLGWDDLSHVMDLCYEVMDADDDGQAWDTLMEHLAYLRKWTVADYLPDLRAGKNPDEVFTVRITPEEAAAALAARETARRLPAEPETLMHTRYAL